MLEALGLLVKTINKLRKELRALNEEVTRFERDANKLRDTVHTLSQDVEELRKETHDLSQARAAQEQNITLFWQRDWPMLEGRVATLEQAALVGRNL